MLLFVYFTKNGIKLGMSFALLPAFGETPHRSVSSRSRRGLIGEVTFSLYPRAEIFAEISFAMRGRAFEN
ncbi:MAG: hypothetical protein DBX55_05195 [Verrucomicrobia bacterium]|nr:MAG: hypothetical protein DBX55_05195 [Verrucomicrobiota bacterium]